MLMQGHIQDLDTGSGVTVIGETLEAALELGEKHEAFVTKCKQVMKDKVAERFSLTLRLYKSACTVSKGRVKIS